MGQIFSQCQYRFLLDPYVPRLILLFKFIDNHYDYLLNTNYSKLQIVYPKLIKLCL